jgi:hypothetical protein
MDKFLEYPPEVQEQILNRPAMESPDGTYNFDNPPNQNKQAGAILAVCLLLVVSMFSLRLYSRLFVMKKLRPEDYIAIAALGFFAGVVWCYVEFLKFPGFFVHKWNIRIRDTIHIAYVLHIFPIAYSVMMLLLKTAILLEWNRIFIPGPQRNAFFWASYGMMLVNILLYVSAIIALALACIPQEKFWHFWLPGKCIDQRKLDICTASFNLAIDLFILLLPQKTIWSLHMTRSRKLGISVIFSVGLLACVCAGGRLYSTISEDYKVDMVHDVSRSFYWALSEATCGIMVFCFPAIPKAFADNAMLTRIIASARSWANIGRSGGSSGHSDGVFPPTIGGAPSNKMYRMMDEDGQAISTTELALIHEQKSAGHGERGAGIMRTTEVDQHGDSMSIASKDHRVERQHPWMGR